MKTLGPPFTPCDPHICHVRYEGREASGGLAPRRSAPSPSMSSPRLIRRSCPGTDPEPRCSGETNSALRAVTTRRNADSGFGFQIKANLSGLRAGTVRAGRGASMALPKCHSERLQLVFTVSLRREEVRNMVRNMSRSSQAFPTRRISLQTEGSAAEEHAVQTISLQWNLQSLITDW